MIAVVEVDIALARPPRADATVRCVVASDLPVSYAGRLDCELTAMAMVNGSAPSRDERGKKTGRPTARTYGGGPVAMVVGCRTIQTRESWE